MELHTDNVTEVRINENIGENYDHQIPIDQSYQSPWTTCIIKIVMQLHHDSVKDYDNKGVIHDMFCP